jgi:hypothetical protein
LANGLQGRFQLIAAIAAQGAQGIAGQTFGMKAQRNIAPSPNIPMNHGNVLFGIPVVPKGHNLKWSKAAGQIGDGHNPHAYFVLAKSRAIMVVVISENLFNL